MILKVVVDDFYVIIYLFDKPSLLADHFYP